MDINYTNDDHRKHLLTRYTEATDRQTRLYMLVHLLGLEVPPFDGEWPDLVESRRVEGLAEGCAKAIELAEWYAKRITRLPVSREHDNSFRELLALLPEARRCVREIRGSMRTSIEVELERLEDAA